MAGGNEAQQRRQGYANRQKRADDYLRSAQKQVDTAKKRGVKVTKGMPAEAAYMMKKIKKTPL